MRPSGLTEDASTMMRLAPPVANAPKWTWCHWFTTPSTAEYWHIGETQRRSKTVRERRVMGLNRLELTGNPLARENPSSVARRGF
jgi:hypothetical protein